MVPGSTFATARPRSRSSTATVSSPDGQVASDLLVTDAAAPFGVRTRSRSGPRRVRPACGRSDEARGVVLVEASDLARLRRYERVTDRRAVRRRCERPRSGCRRPVRPAAREVDPETDGVLVVAPTEGRRKLTVTALRTPGSSPGYVKSASSQHDGVAIAIDVGPTILDLFGIDFTERMEGRPYEIVPSDASLAARSDQFIEEAHGLGPPRRAAGTDDRDPRRPARRSCARGTVRSSRSSARASRRSPAACGRMGGAVRARDVAEHAARAVGAGGHRGLRAVPRASVAGTAAVIADGRRGSCRVRTAR